VGRSSNPTALRGGEPDAQGVGARNEITLPDTQLPLRWAGSHPRSRRKFRGSCVQDKVEVHGIHHPTPGCGPHMGFGAGGVQTDEGYLRNDGKLCIWRRKRFFGPG